jgi:gephyrin
MSVDSPISVEEAIRRVLLHVEPLQVSVLRLGPELLGRTLAQDVVARENFPPFAASIMDGYAVVCTGSLEPGDFTLCGAIHAGESPAGPLLPGQVAYITTGAMLPEGANAVVKVEVTERVGEIVSIKEGVLAGENVREIGSDIAQGEALLTRGQV